MKLTRVLLPSLTLALVPLTLASPVQAEPANDWRQEACAGAGTVGDGGDYSSGYTVSSRLSYSDPEIAPLNITEEILVFSGKRCVLIFSEGATSTPSNFKLDAFTVQYKRTGTLEVEDSGPIEGVTVKSQTASVPSGASLEPFSLLIVDTYSLLDGFVVPSTPAFPESLWGKDGVVYSPNASWTAELTGQKTVTSGTATPTAEEAKRIKKEYQALTLSIKDTAKNLRSDIHKSDLSKAKKKAAIDAVDEAERKALARAKADYEAAMASGTPTTTVTPFSRTFSNTVAA